MLRKKKSQMGVIEAILLIAVLLVAMIFFTTQMDSFTRQSSNQLREKTFREIGNYVVSSGVQSESAWVKKEKKTMEMTIPLDETGKGQNDVFSVEKVNDSTVQITELLGETEDSLDVSLAQTFYIGLDENNIGSYGAEPFLALTSSISSDYRDPLNIYMLGEFEFLEFERVIVGGEQREVVHIEVARRLAILGIDDNMTNRNYDFEGDVKVPDIFEVLTEMGAEYYPIRYRVEPALMNLYSSIIVPSSLEGLVDNLEGPDDEDKREVIHDFVSGGGGLIVLSQKYVSSTNPYDPIPIPTEPDLRKEVYDFIPTKVIFNYGTDGIDYNLLTFSGEEIIPRGVTAEAISGYFPTAAGYIEVPETQQESLDIMIRENEVESEAAGNTGDYPVMISQQWGAGAVVTTTLLLDSRTVITVEVGEQVTKYVKPAIITGSYRHQFRDLVDRDHDGVMEYVKEDQGDAYIPYIIVEKPVLGNIDITNFCAVIVAGEPPSGMAWGHTKQLYRDGGSVFSTADVAKGGLLHASAEIGIKNVDPFSIGTGGDVDPANVNGTIYYNINSYAEGGNNGVDNTDEIPMEWDNLLICDPDVMRGFDTFWTFDVVEELNSETGDDDLEEAGFISFDPSGSVSDPNARRHNYIKRTNYDENVAGDMAHHGLFYIGEPLELMGGHVLEAVQSKDVSPGVTIDYPFTVANYGDTATDFSLTATSSSGWTVEILEANTLEAVSNTYILDPMEDTYASGNTYYFNGIVRVHVPDAGSVTGGEVDKTILEVKDGSTVVGKSVIKTRIKEGVTITPGTQYGHVYSSNPQAQEYTLTVHNLTDTADTIDFEIAGNSWASELQEVNGTALTDSDSDGDVDVDVSANSSYDIVLQVAPGSPSAGDSSTATITATSSNILNNSFSAEVATTCIDDTVYDPSSNLSEILATSTDTSGQTEIESSAEKIGRFYGQQVEDIMTDSVKLIYKTIIGINFGGQNIFFCSIDNADPPQYIQIDQDDNGLHSPPQYDEKGYNLPELRGGYPEGGEETGAGTQSYYFIDEEQTYLGDLFELMLYVREQKVTHAYILNNIIPGPDENNPLEGTQLELLNEENVKLFRNMLIYTATQVTSMKKAIGPKILLDLNRKIGDDYYRIIGEGNTVRVVALDDASVYAEVNTQGMYVTGQVNTAVSRRVYLVVTDYGVYLQGE